MKFKCESSNSSKNGGFINKLVAKINVTATFFGVVKTTEQKVTYYIKTDQQIPLGTEDTIDFTKFDVVERPFVVPTTGEEIFIKWLVAKRAIATAPVARRVGAQTQPTLAAF